MCRFSIVASSKLQLVTEQSILYDTDVYYTRIFMFILLCLLDKTYFKSVRVYFVLKTKVSVRNRLFKQT